MLKKLVAVSLFYILLLVPTTVNAHVLRIFGVQSYTMNHICGTPQLVGFKEELSKLGVKYVMHVYYMRSRTVFTARSELKVESDWIVERIKEFKPDVVVLFDDIAFEYIAPKLPKNIPIIFSGMNNYYHNYLKKFPSLKEHKISGVEELVSLNKLLPLLQDIDLIVIIYGTTDTSQYALTNILLELDKLKDLSESFKDRVEIRVMRVRYLYQLQDLIDQYNTSDKSVLFIITLQRVIDKRTYRYLKSVEILKYFQQHDYNQLTLFPNIAAVKYVAISIGPNFYEMGKIAADLLQRLVIDHGSPTIVIATSYLYASRKNIDKMHKTEFLEKYMEDFDEVRP